MNSSTYVKDLEEQNEDLKRLLHKAELETEEAKKQKKKAEEEARYIIEEKEYRKRVERDTRCRMVVTLNLVLAIIIILVGILV
jgi:hypothetical protein